MYDSNENERKEELRTREEQPVVTVLFQTFARSFAEIRDGEDPWVALGK